MRPTAYAWLAWLVAFALTGVARAQETLAAVPVEAAAPIAPTEPSHAERERVDAKLAAMQAQIEGLQAQAALRELDGSDDSALLELTEPTLSFYGFMDFGFDRFFLEGKRDDDLGILRPTPAGTFVFGNLNTYVSAEIDPHWQALVELRFTVAPHGEETQLDPPLGTSYERVDSTAFDFSSPSAQSQLRLGSIFIERAYSEWRPTDWFRLRAGSFLNPFGIWNVDHGSPTLIALSLPTFVAGQMMPARLLGMQALGDLSWDRSRLSYYVHVSNGRTPLDFDLTDDKAIGARLTLTVDFDASDLMLGVSTYHGTFDDTHKVIDLAAASMTGQGFFDWESVAAYREHVWGLDVSYDLGDLRLRAEGVGRWVYYEEGKRQRVFHELGEPRFTADRFEWDVYAIAAYRLPFDLEPYAMMETARKSFLMPRFAGAAQDTTADALVLAPSLGLNVHFTARVMLKAQAQRLTLFAGPESQHQWDAYVIFTRLVTSF